MSKQNVTFVTSYLRIYESEYDMKKTFEKRLDCFIKLVELDINICIFTSKEYEILFNDLCIKYKNVKLIDVCSVDDLVFTKLAKNCSENTLLPINRSIIKDTHNYMYLMHSKIDFLKRTIDVNPFNTDFFSWFDFSLPNIFQNIDNSLQIIKLQSKRNYIKTFIALPGCINSKINYDFTNMEQIQKSNYLGNNILWRFCGGYIIGDKNSLLNFYNVSLEHFTNFLNLSNNILTWEVNYWAWLEYKGYFSPIWYNANHNDTIIDIPPCVYILNILNMANHIIDYKYPAIPVSDDKFFPSAASYSYDDINKKHILNTRYVNYYYKDNWDCDFFNNIRQIRTINVCSELNDSYHPEYYKIMYVDESTLTPNIYAFSQGLEDIRIYKNEKNNKLQFIASNVNYVPFLKNRMIIGDYDYKNQKCNNCKMVNMSWDSNCEKNWVPLPFHTDDNEKLFIYKWSPFTVGYITEENIFRTSIEQKYQNSIVNRFRGSTPFIEYKFNNKDYYIGIVHFSEQGVPPIYYHSIVLLDTVTKLPLYYSNPFKFGNQKIEFCIGFSLSNDKSEYLFWISQMDREPLFFKIDINKIPISNIVE